MSDAGRGLPLLSGPPPEPGGRNVDSCRKCGRDFNIIFTRGRKCNHCGYEYCHSCTDYQALMPRTANSTITGYDPMNVCGFCIDNLTITASGRAQLKGMSLSKLKGYLTAYNIKTDRAVEKDDLIDAIINARSPNGCLPRAHENYYRKYSVPTRPTGGNRRGFFNNTRSGQASSSSQAPPPPPRRDTRPEFARPDLEPDSPPPPPPRESRPYATRNTPPRPPPAQPQYAPPPGPPPRPQSAFGYTPPPGPPPHFYTPPPQGHSHNNNPQGFYPFGQADFPPNQQQSSSQPYNNARNPGPPPAPPRYPNQSQRADPGPPPPPPPRPRAASTVPPPTLEQMLNMTSDEISSMSISSLKKILFTNHVNAGQILEKSELVRKVIQLVDDERRERERQRRAEEREEMERIQRQMETAWDRDTSEQRIDGEQDDQDHGRPHENHTFEQDGSDQPSDSDGHIDPHRSDDHQDNPSRGPEGLARPTSAVTGASSSPPKATSTYAKPSSIVERTGLCVVCQDEEANIAIVDCGHLAMCRGCSDLIMSGSRECPLCRTRIVTEARLLRIFKT